jgi:hypothetical protein
LQDTISFLTLPGVGRGKNVSFSLMDRGREIWRSNMMTFAYDPPSINMTMPNPVYILDPKSSNTNIKVFGRNFGRLQDEATWTPSERVLDMDVSGYKCDNGPRRRSDRGVEWVECTLPRDIVVGTKNITLEIAGQVGFHPEDTPFSLLVVCGYGWFGFSGEQCMSCPSGAVCNGFVTADTANSTGLRRGRYDGREVVDMGIHTYPIPLAGFFNLNGTMAAACPAGEKLVVEGRDVCIVACLPEEACIGSNFCADAYRSVEPFYRCGSCNKGYYRVAGDCMKCPNSPVALIIGMLVLAIAAAGGAYLLHRMNINLAFMSIGIDYMQVLAIFANSKVNWPEQLKNLFRILSAFNLNIEIVAPECLVPDVSFKTKWGIIMALPVAVFLIFFLLHNVSWCWIRLIKRQRISKDRSHALKSASVLLMYFLYLYLTRTILDIFNCVPSPKVPPERDAKGKIITYLQAAQTEPCGLKGGTQLSLLPFAIVGFFVYVLGYPAFLGHLFWRKRELIMEDQLLRAMDTGNDRLSNPNAYGLRRAFGRTYYQFRPDVHFWVLFIVARKFLISVVALIFRLNPQFQLAMMLLVLFLAYSLQVKFNPYMSPADHGAIVASHLQKAATGDLIHSRLHAVLETIRVRQGKKPAGFKLRLFFEGRFQAAALFGWVGQWLFDYNVVEAILLFSAVLVCLMGIMFSALKNGAQYADMYAGLTWAVLVLIVVTIIYFTTVVVIEIWQQCQHRKRARIDAVNKKAGNIWERAGTSDRAAAKQKANFLGMSEIRAGGMPGRGQLDSLSNVPESNVNPMLLHSMDGEDGEDFSNLDLKTIAESSTPPSAAMWEVLRKRILLLIEQLEAFQRQRREDQVNAHRVSAAGGSNRGKGVKNNGGRKNYGPTIAGNGHKDFDDDVIAMDTNGAEKIASSSNPIFQRAGSDSGSAPGRFSIFKRKKKDISESAAGAPTSLPGSLSNLRAASSRSLSTQ